MIKGDTPDKMPAAMSPSTAEFGWPCGDRPGALKFQHDVPATVSNAILSAVADRLPAASGHGARVRALHRSDQPAGAYRLTVAGEEWFVRVTSRWGNPELEKAIVGYLANAGVSVNAAVMTGTRMRWQDRELRVDARPLIRGRHFDGSGADLRALATALGALDRALAEFPRCREVRDAASTRYEWVAAARDLIAEALSSSRFEIFGEQATWAKRHVGWLKEMVEQFVPDYDTGAEAQCLHGEVHPGNVIFDDEQGSAVLVDFEESVHTFAPPAWDLAFMVQRFCLNDRPTRSVACERVRIVEDAYGSPLPPLAAMMRQTAWLSIAKIVALQAFCDIGTPASEHEKFLALDRQAREYEGIV